MRPEALAVMKGKLISVCIVEERLILAFAAALCSSNDDRLFFFHCINDYIYTNRLVPYDDSSSISNDDDDIKQTATSSITHQHGQ